MDGEVGYVIVKVVVTRVSRDEHSLMLSIVIGHSHATNLRVILQFKGFTLQ